MPHVDEKVFLEFHAISLVNGLKYWLIQGKQNISGGRCKEFYQYMMSHSILDLLDIENTGEKIRVSLHRVEPFSYNLAGIGYQ